MAQMPIIKGLEEKLQPSHIMKLSKAQSRQPRASGVLSRSGRSKEATLEDCMLQQRHGTRGAQTAQCTGLHVRHKKADESKAIKREKTRHFPREQTRSEEIKVNAVSLPVSFMSEL